MRECKVDINKSLVSHKELVIDVPLSISGDELDDILKEVENLLNEGDVDDVYDYLENEGIDVIEEIDDTEDKVEYTGYEISCYSPVE